MDLDGVKSFVSGESDDSDPVNRMGKDEIHIDLMGEGYKIGISCDGARNFMCVFDGCVVNA